MTDRLWRGWLKSQPLNPDSTIARHLNWSSGGRGGYATVGYPEPVNITAASAWVKLNKDNIPDDAIIYRDSKTNLWIVAVDIRFVPPDKAEDWGMEQAYNGAIAFWVNDKPCPLRQQLPPELLFNLDINNPLERRGRKKGVSQLQSCKPVVTPLGAFISKKVAHRSHNITLVTFNKLMMREPDKYYSITMEQYEEMINNSDINVS